MLIIAIKLPPNKKILSTVKKKKVINDILLLYENKRHSLDKAADILIHTIRNITHIINIQIFILEL